MKSVLFLSLVMNISLANAMEITKGESHQAVNIVNTSIEERSEDSALTTTETDSSSSETTEAFRKMIASREVFREAHFNR